jgi:hypothetical protein
MFFSRSCSTHVVLSNKRVFITLVTDCNHLTQTVISLLSTKLRPDYQTRSRPQACLLPNEVRQSDGLLARAPEHPVVTLQPNLPHR